MTLTIQIEDNFQKYMSYLAMFNENDELCDFFVNLKPTNEMYLETHQNLLQAGSKNCRMFIRDQEGNAMSILENMLDKVSFKIYNPDEFVKTFPSLFVDE